MSVSTMQDGAFSINKQAEADVQSALRVFSNGFWKTARSHEILHDASKIYGAWSNKDNKDGFSTELSVSANPQVSAPRYEGLSALRSYMNIWNQQVNLERSPNKFNSNLLTFTVSSPLSYDVRVDRVLKYALGQDIILPAGGGTGLSKLHLPDLSAVVNHQTTVFGGIKTAKPKKTPVTKTEGPAPPSIHHPKTVNISFIDPIRFDPRELGLVPKKTQPKEPVISKPKERSSDPVFSSFAGVFCSDLPPLLKPFGQKHLLSAPTVLGPGELYKIAKEIYSGGQLGKVSLPLQSNSSFALDFGYDAAGLIRAYLMERWGILSSDTYRTGEGTPKSEVGLYLSMQDSQIKSAIQTRSRPSAV